MILINNYTIMTKIICDKHDIILKNSDIGAFGARTNRVGYSWQLLGNIDVDNHDIKYHRVIGKHLQKTYFLVILLVQVL
mgnify:CR=1 FL=1